MDSCGFSVPVVVAPVTVADFRQRARVQGSVRDPTEIGGGGGGVRGGVVAITPPSLGQLRHLFGESAVVISDGSSLDLARILRASLSISEHL